MKKMKLSLDDLKVESFQTTPEGAEGDRGTVYGYISCDLTICQECGPTCACTRDPSCNGTCAASCNGTCYASCGGTCNVSCNGGCGGLTCPEVCGTFACHLCK
jgi:hypothetical protein